MAWPAQVSTNDSLYHVSDLVKTTLNGSIDSVVTSLVLNNGTNFPGPTGTGVVLIVAPSADPTTGELIRYDSVSGNSLLSLTRGFGGTTASAHADTDAVFFVSAAEHHNVLKDEIIQIEQDLFTRHGTGDPALPDASTTLDTEHMVFADASISNITVTLPPIGSPLAQYTIKKIDASANTVTVDGDGADIDTAPTKVISVQDESYTFVDDGSQWRIV